MTLSKINRKRHSDGGNMAIELPTLNMALVKVNQELARVRLGAKDIGLQKQASMAHE